MTPYRNEIRVRTLINLCRLMSRRSFDLQRHDPSLILTVQKGCRDWVTRTLSDDGSS